MNLSEALLYWKIKKPSVCPRDDDNNHMQTTAGKWVQISKHTQSESSGTSNIYIWNSHLFTLHLHNQINLCTGLLEEVVKLGVIKLN